MIRVVIVDDEPLALKQLELYVSRSPDLRIVASCPSAAVSVNDNQPSCPIRVKCHMRVPS